MDHVRPRLRQRDARPDHASRRQVTQGVAARRRDHEREPNACRDAASTSRTRRRLRARRSSPPRHGEATRSSRSACREAAAAPAPAPLEPLQRSVGMRLLAGKIRDHRRLAVILLDGGDAGVLAHERVGRHRRRPRACRELLRLSLNLITAASASMAHRSQLAGAITSASTALHSASCRSYPRASTRARARRRCRHRTRCTRRRRRRRHAWCGRA